jgi:hypothetical protein
MERLPSTVSEGKESSTLYLLGLLVVPEHGRSVFLWNIGTFTGIYGKTTQKILLLMATSV